MAQQGYLVISDITGYTAFMTGSELEHAQDILSSLFDTLLEHTRPPLVVSKLEGDAIFSYAPQGSFLQGQTLLELVESIYFAFRQTQEQMRFNTTCTCNACQHIPRLDLKFFVHYGEYSVQDIRGREELAGPDVILVHRLLKNHVVEATGKTAYALFTQAAVKALALEEYCAAMIAHAETYEHLGEVPGYVHCLHVAWDAYRQRRHVVVEDGEILFEYHVDVPVPPSLVWDYLYQPERRTRWMGVKGIRVTDQYQGRVGLGTVLHCDHGSGSSPFRILDWRPFHYMTSESPGPLKGISDLATVYLEPTPAGTHIHFVQGTAQARNSLLRFVGRLLYRVMKPIYIRMIGGTIDRIPTVIEEDMSAGQLVMVAPAPISAEEIAAAIRAGVVQTAGA